MSFNPRPREGATIFYLINYKTSRYNRKNANLFALQFTGGFMYELFYSLTRE